MFLPLRLSGDEACGWGRFFPEMILFFLECGGGLSFTRFRVEYIYPPLPLLFLPPLTVARPQVYLSHTKITVPLPAEQYQKYKNPLLRESPPFL